MPSPPPPAADPSAYKRWWHSPWIWIVLSAAAFIAGAMTLSYFFFTAPIPDSPPDTTGLDPATATRQNATAELAIARLRADARRNTLALGGGLAALAALALAVRRQHHHERATADARAEELRRQKHLEEKAADEKASEQRRQLHLEEDALQRRITESRVSAVAQLGSDNPAVRIGGLHNLERIGQVHKELRQVVLDEVCSYLRLPFTTSTQESKVSLPARQFEPIGVPSAEVETDEAEHEVRLIAQEILQRHLNPDAKLLYWDHSRLNLRNSFLDTVKLGKCQLTKVDFSNAIFTGKADFRGAIFTGETRFGGTTFTAEADFRGTTFAEIEFENVTFYGRAYFGGTKFTRDTSFKNVTFADEAFFVGSTFDRAADFMCAMFKGKTQLMGATFNSRAEFRGASFSRHTSLVNMTFTKGAEFGPETHTNLEGIGNVIIVPIPLDTTFADVRFHGPILEEDLTLPILLHYYRVLIDIEIASQLADGWILEPDPSDSRWGRLRREAEPENGREDMRQ
ncbi:pentapeptide repeat-containing protein [Glycomyces sp. NPDC021274]|uniref:pentapeptide repeat-containing protein n=1 Tax=Glycomyces sp. NPDC021274 TaxID=3155120 RepID=UPI0034117AA9